MTHDDAFLQAIIERPDDDAPRLIYADYLDERDDLDRAEFIRLQCRLARLPLGASGRAELEALEKDLLTKHQQEWLGRLRAVPAGWIFRRGFVDAVNASGHGFLDHAHAIFEAAPVRHAEICPEGTLPLLASCLEMNRLESLALRFAFYDAGDEDFRLLAGAPALLRALTELYVTECDISPFALGAVLASPHLSGMRRLELDCVPFHGAEGARVLAEARGATCLESLVLHNSLLGDEGARVLKDSQAFGRLTNLSLYRCGLSEEGVQLVARSRCLANLNALRLSGNRVGNNGAWALGESPYIGGVRRLDLFDCHIGDAGAKGLARSPHLEQLELLNLGSNYLTKHGRQVLRDRFGDRVHVEPSNSAY